jgi:hypothetical protein
MFDQIDQMGNLEFLLIFVALFAVIILIEWATDYMSGRDKR